MGDPRKAKKRFENPRHPWQKARIEEEKVLIREYGLKNKREIYKHTTAIKRIVDHFKKLSYQEGNQAIVEKEQLQKKLLRLGLLKSDQDLSAVLDLKIANALERRLQTLVFKKNLARSVKQARQFITHRHITVNGRIIDVPSYVVSLEEESSIGFIANSSLFSEDHPERAIDSKVSEIKEKVDNSEEKEIKAVEEQVSAKVEEVIEEPVAIEETEETKAEVKEEPKVEAKEPKPEAKPEAKSEEKSEEKPAEAKE